ncbi:YciI family protein [soil metagenome]
MQRLDGLLKAGRLVLAGAHPAIDSPDPGPAGFSGSLIVAEFDSLAEASKWAESDPFVTAGAYARVHVKPFRQVLP